MKQALVAHFWTWIHRFRYSIQYRLYTIEFILKTVVPFQKPVWNLIKVLKERAQDATSAFTQQDNSEAPKA